MKKIDSESLWKLEVRIGSVLGSSDWFVKYLWIEPKTNLCWAYLNKDTTNLTDEVLFTLDLSSGLPLPVNIRIDYGVKPQKNWELIYEWSEN